MRLRTRLALAFALLALVPLAVVVPLALGRLRATLADELDTRADAAAASARESLERSARQATRAVEELAASDAMEDLLREAHESPRDAWRADTAAGLMAGRGLTVLALLDAGGRTLSSGHLPARRGDPDPALLAVARAGGREPVAVAVEVRGEAGLRRVPALVTARAVDDGALRVWAVGGVLLDEAMAQHLARLTGGAAQLELLEPPAAGGPYEALRRAPGAVRVAAAGEAPPPVVERVLPVGDAARVRLTFSRARASEAEAGVLRAFLALAGAGLALAAAGGLWAARRITRPVEALTAGVRRVAEGALDVQVDAQASGEVGELVRAFNRMTGELRTTTEQLVSAERVAAWQEVARRLAHEVKNPLTPIRMSLETLLAAESAGPAFDARFHAMFRDSAGVVLEEVERLRRIVDEFGRFARLPAPQLAPLDLAELARTVLTLYASPPAGLTVRAELAEGVRTRADRDQLTQVLVNLVKNAEEAVLEGPGRAGTVTVRVRGLDAEAVLEVEDTGPGIPPDQRARVFEPYFTSKSGGSGLGLAIAARIVQEHGGRLEVGEPAGAAPGATPGALLRVVLPRRRD